jgi:WD40 repeat protein
MRSAFSSRPPTATAGPCRQFLLATLVNAILFTVASLAPSARAQNEATSPSSSSPQSGLPSLRLVRTLSAPNEISTLGMPQSGNSNMTISPDGERLAAYVHFGVGIILWSPDGKYVKEIHRHSNFGLGAGILAFVSGHSQLVTSPAAETNSQEDRDKADHAAFSVLDADTGKVVRSIEGPNSAQGAPENSAYELAVSPDQRLVAVVYGRRDPLIGIYGTSDWHLVTAIRPLSNTQVDPRALTFSTDGRILAVARGRKGAVQFYNVGTWDVSRTLEAFSDKSPAVDPLLAGIAFSPDGAMVAIASFDGGLWRLDSNGKPTGSWFGVLKQEFPVDPLRVFGARTGDHVASLGSFPGVKIGHAISWSPAGNYLAFLDGLGDIRLWDPSQPGLAISAASMGLNSSTLAFTPDGSLLMADDHNGIKVFEVIPQTSEKLR